MPDPKHNCGPYEKSSDNDIDNNKFSFINMENHDTIGMIVMDDLGNIAAGTSSNGAKFKIPG